MQPGGVDDLVAYGGQPAAGGIAHETQPGQLAHGAGQRQHAGRVGAQVAAHAELLARQHDAHAVIADRSADQDAVAGGDLLHTQLHPVRAYADAGGGEVHPAALAMGQHLGVARNHLHAGFARRRADGTHQAFELLHRHAFLDEGVEGEVQRIAAGYRQVVAGAVHRQGADVAAGEFQRFYGKAVGGEQRLPGRQVDAGGVGIGVQVGAGQVAGEQLFDQFAHVASAVSVGESDVSVLHELHRC